MNHAENHLSVPPDACDCHAHVFLPTQFPYAADRRYTPPAADIDALRAHRTRLGTGRTVLVQPSCYGDDNAAMLAALATLGQRSARGVVVVDLASITDADLLHLHDQGVRGARLNLHTLAQANSLDRSAYQCRQAAERIRSLGWHVQLHIDAKRLAHLLPTLKTLDVALVLDHFGGGADVVDLVAQLLRAGHTWVKLSAPYRVSTQSDYADLANATQHYLRVAPEKLLWASDWPHTGGNGVRRGDAHAIEPFRQEDALATLARLAGWIGDAKSLHTILVDNPARLYDF